MYVVLGHQTLQGKLSATGCGYCRTGTRVPANERSRCEGDLHHVCAERVHRLVAARGCWIFDSRTAPTSSERNWTFSLMRCIVDARSSALLT